MLKINDEILKKIGVDYCFISGSVNSFVHPLVIERHRWLVAVDSRNMIPGAGYALNIHTENSTIKISVAAEKKDKDMYFLVFGTEAENREFQALSDKFVNLEKKIEEWSRRTEKRYKVGLVKSSDFGLADAQQRMLDSKGKELPFAVADVSLHGLKIMTTDSETLQKNSQVCLMLKFSMQFVIVKARIMNKKTRESLTGSGVVLAALNLKIEEDNIAFQELVEKYAEGEKDGEN